MNDLELVRAALQAADLNANRLVMALRPIVENETWRSFPAFNGTTITHDALWSFIEAEPNRGLGLDEHVMRAVLGKTNYVAMARDISEALWAPG